MLEFNHEKASEIAEEMLAQTTLTKLYIKEAEAIQPFEEQADMAKQAIKDFEETHDSDCANWTNEDFYFYMKTLRPQMTEAQDILHKAQEFTYFIKEAWLEVEEA